MWIAGHDHLTSSQEYERKRTFQLEQSLTKRSGECALARSRDQVQNYLGVTGCLENGAFALQFPAQFAGVCNVAIVRYGDLSLVARHQERLRVEQHGVTGGGIAGVADREIARQTCDLFRSEDVRNVAHGLEATDFAIVAGGDTRTLLAAVLQSVQTQISQVRRFGM